MRTHTEFTFAIRTRIIARACTVIVLALASAGLCAGRNSSIESIEQGFVDIPDSTRLAVYWYWLNDNLSKEGVVQDLESMKKAGIGRAYIGFIGIEDVPRGKVKFMGDEWWNVLHTALATAGKLDIEIGIFNSPGWSQSGGPWVKPEQSMRRLKSETLDVNGGGKKTFKLKNIEGGQDVAVIAYPTPRNSFSKTFTYNKKAGKGAVTTLPLKRSATIRTLSVKASSGVNSPAVLSARQGNEWKKVKEVNLDRYNDKLYVGFEPYAPIVETVPDVKASEFSLEFAPEAEGTFEITLSEQPMVERYAEKSLAKMYQEPLPLWGQYMWDASAPGNEGMAIDPAKVVDLTDKVTDGRLTWNVPAGRWTVERIAMVSTGVTNSPALDDATGLETDKMSRKHIETHFNNFIGQILKRIPAADRPTFKIVVEDSYETGGQNWTDDMTEAFVKAYGYSPLPYLPVLNGAVVGSRDISDRFLWDLRRLVADRVAYDYVGGLRDISHRHGLTTWLENYGHWGFPSEFLLYGSQSDEIAGEFWSEGSLGDIENRAASSCGHIYGKPRVWAESCTAGGPAFSRYPAVMKQRVDRFFTEGINASLLHLYTHQDASADAPGIAAWFGNEFNRKNTWYRHLDLFSDYLRRCNHMLQQGRYVADVAYFIGEDAPKMTGVCDPALPAGYSFDYINADVLRNHARVAGGRLVLDSGMEYSLLVLPRQATMRPELLEAIASMVEAGLTVLGPKPETSPSLAGYPACDTKVKSLADRLWSDGSRTIRPYGKGNVCSGCGVAEVLDYLGVAPDMASAPDSVAYIHRTLGDSEIYFIANASPKATNFTASLRVAGPMQAEIWDAVTGECRSLPECVSRGGRTEIPLEMAPTGSCFIVLRKGEKAAQGTNFPDLAEISEFGTPWEASFGDTTVSYPTLASWTEHENSDIRHYAGAATYTNSFNMKALPAENVYLDLGKVMVTARVKVNGIDAGGVWTPPYRLNITPYVREGANTVEVEVANNWKNRLIADESLPEADRVTRTNQRPYRAGEPLQESGLLGPVKVLAAKVDVKPMSRAALALRATAPSDSVLELRNSCITLRQDLRRGGSICHISANGTPRNLVNIFDEGRYIQQSYYAGKRVDRRHEGQSPNWSPWQWNPIQGGNYNRKGARIVKWEKSDSALYIACVPMLWDMDAHEAEALMEQWTSLEGNTIKVKNRISCHRGKDIYGKKAVKNDQEIPAIYPISSLKHLYSYFGSKPFSDDALDNPEVTEIKMGVPGSFWGKYPNVTEKWMAFVDDNMWGMGVYSPKAARFLAGRFSPHTDGEALSIATSYIAPLCTAALTRNSVFEYEYYIVIDSLPQIRKTIYQIHTSLNENL